MAPLDPCVTPTGVSLSNWCLPKRCWHISRDSLVSEAAGVRSTAMTLVEVATPPVAASGQHVMTMALSLRPSLTRSSHNSLCFSLPECRLAASTVSTWEASTRAGCPTGECSPTLLHPGHVACSRTKKSYQNLHYFPHCDEKLRSDRFATIGPVAASPLLGFGQEPVGNISIIDFHGTNDMVSWQRWQDFILLCYLNLKWPTPKSKYRVFF